MQLRLIRSLQPDPELTPAKLGELPYEQLGQEQLKLFPSLNLPPPSPCEFAMKFSQVCFGYCIAVGTIAISCIFIIETVVSMIIMHFP